MKPEKIVILNTKKEKLVGYLYKNTSQKIIIVCHGVESCNNFPDKEVRDAFRRYLSELSRVTGVSVFSFDFSGFGESDGKLSYNLKQRDLEIKTVIDYFSSRYDEIVLYGFSYAGISTAIAATRYKEVRKLITVNGFFTYNPRYSYFSIILLMIWFYILRYPSFIQDFYFIAKNLTIQIIKIPVFVIVSANDRFVKPKQSIRFYKKLMTNKKIFTVQSNDHAMIKENLLLPKEIKNWLRETDS